MARDFSAFDDDPPGDDHGDDHGDDGRDTLAFGRRSARIPLIIAALAALAGVIFAATSTADFVAHLDRQVHDIHCSVVPGAEAVRGESGCRTVMLSPYSSWFRQDYWGGVPVALFAMSVFVFLAYRAGALAVRKDPRKGEVFFLAAGMFLPVLMSIIYGYLASVKVGATCTVCVGMYWSSGIGFVAALVAFFLVRDFEPDPKRVGRFFIDFAEGCAFVLAMFLIYLAFVPEVEAKAGRGPAGCGTLVEPGDPTGIMIDIAPRPGGAPTIELLDPLCPACRGFDERLAVSGLADKLDMKAVLFPLDSTCNWMVKSSLHPGACAVTEAMLCDRAAAPKILKWAFANQDALLEQARKDEPGVRARIVQEFPGVASCLGTPQAKNHVVRSLRWAVANALPVLTPQVFVKGKRMCDEDTDLGLEFTLAQMLEGGAK